MTKRATAKFLTQGRGFGRASAAALALVFVTGCSGSDLASGIAPAPQPVAVVPAQGAPATGADGYPNINVDTAQKIPGTHRTAADMDRIEAELLALGARQKAGADVSAPTSVIQELKDLGRRTKSETEKAIESGAAPE